MNRPTLVPKPGLIHVAKSLPYLEQVFKIKMLLPMEALSKYSVHTEKYKKN